MRKRTTRIDLFPGARVKLIHMNDKHAYFNGLEGIVLSVGEFKPEWAKVKIEFHNLSAEEQKDINKMNLKSNAALEII